MAAMDFYRIFSGPGDAYFKGLEEYQANKAAGDWADSILGAQPKQQQGAGLLTRLGQAIGLQPETPQPRQSLASLGQPYASNASDQPEGIQAINRVSPQGGSNYRDAIASIESQGSGNYQAVGPVTKTGDRALGRYQIMAANLPEWSQAALGRQVTPQEFMASPQIQDAIFDHRFGQYVQKYGPEGAARAWFAGEGGMNNPNARDQLGTTVSSYAGKFNAATAGAPGQPSQRPVQTRLPAGPGGGATAYTSTGQPVMTDSEGNAIQIGASAQPPAVPASPYGTLGMPAGVPDWKGMAAPSFAPQQAQMPSPVAVRPPVPNPQAQPQPYQVAQAGGVMPMAAQAQPPRFTPEQAQALRGLIANPQTRAFGMQLLQQQVVGKTPQWEKLNDGTLYDKNSGRIMSATGGSVYRMLTDPAERAKYGIPDDDKRPYQLDPGGKLSSVGGASTSVTIDQKGEGAFEQEAGKATAKRFNETIEAGTRANSMLGDINTMREISSRVGSQGSAADIKATLGPYAEALGLKLEGLDDIQAFESVIQRLAPQMRVPGSGATSDIEFKGMLAALPRLRNSPEARARIMDTMEANARDAMARGEIASRVMTKEITRAEGEKQLRALPDPMTGFREFRKANPQLFTGPAPQASAPARGQAPASGAAGAPVRVQTPDEARRLPKGTPIILPDGRQGIVP